MHRDWSDTNITHRNRANNSSPHSTSAELTTTGLGGLLLVLLLAGIGIPPHTSMHNPSIHTHGLITWHWMVFDFRCFFSKKLPNLCGTPLEISELFFLVQNALSQKNFDFADFFSLTFFFGSSSSDSVVGSMYERFTQSSSIVYWCFFFAATGTRRRRVAREYFHWQQSRAARQAVWVDEVTTIIAERCRFRMEGCYSSK